MPLHFAAARRSDRSPVARALAYRGCREPANDNGCPSRSDDLMLHAALRHFAEHGLSAAREARRQAEQAFFAGDRASYDWWLAICRALDRRLAAGLVRRTDRLTKTHQSPQ